MLTFLKYLAGLASALFVIVVAGSYVISEGIVDAFIGIDGPVQATAVVAAHEEHPVDMSSMAVPASLLAASGSYSYEEPKLAPRQLEVDGVTRTYQLYVPQTLLPGARPTIVLFHGAERSGASMIDMWREIADAEGAILIAPDASGGTWSWTKDGPGFVSAVIEDVRDDYRLNPLRMYLFGHSDGGAHALRIGNDTSLRWRAVSSHAGFPQSGTIRKTGGLPPVRVYVGTEDHVYSIESSGNAAVTLAQAGHPTEVIRVRGHNHWYYKVGPHLNKDIWKWFEDH